MVDQIVINGQLVSYLQAGDSSKKRTLLFLHGWRSQKEIWNSVIEKLLVINNQLSVFAMDLPGFGGSPAPKRPWTVGDYAEAVQGFIEKLDLKNIIIVGHSFGGRVAVKLCAEKTSIAEKLVLVDSAGFVFNPDKKQMMNLIAKTVKPFFKPKFMQPVRRLVYKTIGAEDYLATLELQQTFVNVVNEDLSEQMEKINMPVLIVWGEKDMETPFEFAGMMKHKIKNSRLAVFEEAGHFSFLDEPERFVKEITDFVVR